MKVTTLLTALLSAGALMIMTSAPVQAQAGAYAPSSQIGFGLAVSSDIGGLLTAQYAFTPAIQAGVELGVASSSNDAQSATGTVVGPFVRWILEGKVNPIIQAGLWANSTSTTSKGAGPGGADLTSSSSSTRIYGAFGFEWYHNRNVGIYSLIDVINLDSDPSTTTFGILHGRVGVEMFLDP